MDIYQGNIKPGIKNIIEGVGISFIVTVVLLFILASILTYSSVQENIINPSIIVITAISILIGSSIKNKKMTKNGILNGGLVGGIYIAIIYLISSLLNWEFRLNMQSLLMILIGMFFGIIGGIIGVNQKK